MSSSPPIDVLHLITSLETGGAQRMLHRLATRTDPARVRSRVVSLVDGGAWAERLAADGVPVEGLGLRPGRPDPRGLLRLRRLLGRHRPQVLQTWLYHADLLGTLARSAGGRPALAWNLRCTHAPRVPGASAAARAAPHLCARLSRRPDVVVTNSEAGRRSHEAIGWRPRRWVRIPNGFDLAELSPDPAARGRLRAELGLGPEALLVGHVARWHPMKDHAATVVLAERLAPRFPELAVVLVGAGLEPDGPAMNRLLAGSPVADRVHALGERGDVPALLAGLDLCVSPSTYYEGFPNVLGEALACGVPCVASDVGDSGEIVGEAGAVVPPGDREALVAAVASLLELGAAERRALGARGREHVAERYELGRVVRRYEELYAELAGTAAAPVAPAPAAHHGPRPS